MDVHIDKIQKKTLLRKSVYSLGVDCFAPVLEKATREAVVDGEAAEDYGDVVRQTRINRTKEYYDDLKNMHELVVLVVLYDVLDSFLLFPMLGDPPSKFVVGLEDKLG